MLHAVRALQQAARKAFKHKAGNTHWSSGEIRAGVLGMARGLRKIRGIEEGADDSVNCLQEFLADV